MSYDLTTPPNKDRVAYESARFRLTIQTDGSWIVTKLTTGEVCHETKPFVLKAFSRGMYHCTLRPYPENLRMADDLLSSWFPSPRVPLMLRPKDEYDE